MRVNSLVPKVLFGNPPPLNSVSCAGRETEFPWFPNSCLGTLRRETPIRVGAAKQSFGNQRSQTGVRERGTVWHDLPGKSASVDRRLAEARRWPVHDRPSSFSATMGGRASSSASIFPWFFDPDAYQWTIFWSILGCVYVATAVALRENACGSCHCC